MVKYAIDDTHENEEVNQVLSGLMERAARRAAALHSDLAPADHILSALGTLMHRMMLETMHQLAALPSPHPRYEAFSHVLEVAAEETGSFISTCLQEPQHRLGFAHQTAQKMMCAAFHDPEEQGG